MDTHAEPIPAHAPISPPPPPGPEALRPVAPSERLNALDAVRGFALLGIFLVNIQGFKAPFGKMMGALPASTDTTLDQVAHYATRLLAEGKFYPLFSMLFGMGMAIQVARVARAMKSFPGFYWKRLFVLLLIGLPHAVLLWYGDILIIYSVVGFVFMWFVRARAETLAIVGGLMLLISVLIALAFGTIGFVFTPSPADAALAAPDVSPVMTAGEAPPTGGPFERWIDMFQQSGSERLQPNDPRWMAIETDAYRNGPFFDSTLLRASSYLMMVGFWVVASGGFFHILAMFCFGAALYKAGVFTPERRSWWMVFLAIGAAVGLPLSALYAFGGAWFGDTSFFYMIIAFPCNLIGGPLLSLAYLGGICTLVQSGASGVVTRLFAPVGRMALTSYLLQSLVASFVMLHWGLARFGEYSRGDGALFVIVVYAGQIVFAAAWLSVFRMGPMEWVWRSLTYLKPQKLLRERKVA